MEFEKKSWGHWKKLIHAIKWKKGVQISDRSC